MVRAVEALKIYLSGTRMQCKFYVCIGSVKTEKKKHDESFYLSESFERARFLICSLTLKACSV